MTKEVMELNHDMFVTHHHHKRNFTQQNASEKQGREDRIEQGRIGLMQI